MMVVCLRGGRVPSRNDFVRLARRLPLLAGEAIPLRELQLSDAPTLLAMLSTEEVPRFHPAAPTTLKGTNGYRVTHKKRRRRARLLRHRCRTA